jgi:small conductance mechanosensitive channel
MAPFNNIWLDLLFLIGIIVIIFIIYKIIAFMIARAARTGRIPPDVVNGLKLFLRLIVVIVIIILVVSLTNLPPEITLGISAIFGTVIGFASIQGIQNFISGLYIIITRPFGINDLVAIDKLEGIITEISLNYTKVISTSGKRMLISNRNVLNSNIINYTKQGKMAPKDEKSAIGFVKHVLAGKEITQYAFSLELPRLNPRKTMAALEETVSDWESKFDTKPEYFLWSLGQFATFRLILTAREPKTILENKPLFIKDLYKRAYKK